MNPNRTTPAPEVTEAQARTERPRSDEETLAEILQMLAIVAGDEPKN